MSESNLCCFANNSATPRLFYLGSTGNVHLASWAPPNSEWLFSNLTSLVHGADPAAPDSALACFAGDGTDSHVHFLNSKSEVCQIAFENNQWAFHNLTQDAKPFDPKQPVKSAAPGSALTCFGLNGTDTRVYYVDSDANVCQIAFETNQWISHNLSQAATPADPKQPVKPAAPGTALTCFGAHGSDARVYFVDKNGSVCEIAFVNNKWVFTNLTQAAVPTDKNQPVKAAQSSSALTCFGYKGDDARVYFQDDASHVCEMAWANNRWEFTNISAVAKPRPNQGPPNVPAARSSLTCFGANGLLAHVYYLDDSSFIWELAWDGNSWIGFAALAEANIATNTNAQAAAGTALACFGLNAQAARVYYLRWQGDINELAYNLGQNQWVNRTIIDTRAPSSPVGGATLKSNSNYSLVSGSNPLVTGISVNITITQPMILKSDSPAQPGSSQVTGFGFQLNALSPSKQLAPGDTTEQIVWQQYLIALVGNQLQGIINNWTSVTTWKIDTYNSPAVLGPPLAGSVIPAGYQLNISLGNDSTGNVVWVAFSVMDNLGNRVGYQAIQLSSLVSSQFMAPITAFGLYVVGPANSEKATLTDGSGMITYSAADKLVVSPLNAVNLPTTLVEQGIFTAEKANSFYGLLPQTGTLTGFPLGTKMFAQPFKIGGKPQ
jgi:Fungal fucose-specific lectin